MKGRLGLFGSRKGDAIRSTAGGRPVLSAAILTLLGLSYWLFPGHHGLLTQIFVLALFALSYDLLQGHAGIVSLGHAAFFGTGAYACALLAQAGLSDPLLGLAASGALAAALALALTPIIVRGTDFTRLLITLGVGIMIHEAANQMRWLTGGADGFGDFEIGPILGLFRFDIAGRTGFVYAWLILLLVYLGLWRVVHSPFGLALRALRENPRRMPAIGAAVSRHLAMTYVMSGAIAGVAGALMAQTNRFVSLDAFSFERSADVTIIVTLGGMGNLVGAVLGSAVFLVIKDTLSAISPKYWQLGLGVVLMASVLGLRGGLVSVADLPLGFVRRALGRGAGP